MKILVTQLARLGDIFLTYPSINALRRQFPDAEIHMLVREKFKSACCYLSTVDKIIELKTRDILEPVVVKGDDEFSLLKIEGLVLDLKSENYTNIINLSFSPMSSYLVHAISGAETQVFGYTRFSDGYLSIPDDSSAYFYGQVGVHRWNRVHVADIFASVCGVELKKEDWELDDIVHSTYSNALPEKYLVLHIGASQKRKTLTAFKWRQIIKQILKNWDGTVVLIGSKDERVQAQETLNGLETTRVISLVGDTRVSDLFPIIKNSDLVIGPDSMAIHIASLTQVKSLNISLQSVRFWETGPYLEGSRVIFEEEEDLLASDRVSEEVISLLNLQMPFGMVFEKVADVNVNYKNNSKERFGDFTWQLIQALYMGTDFPELETMEQELALRRLKELTVLGIEQIEQLLDPEKQSTPAKILDQIDDLMLQVVQLVWSVQPMVGWFTTEKTRIAPGSFEKVLNATYDIYKKFELILSVYVPEPCFEDQGERDANNEMG